MPRNDQVTRQWLLLRRLEGFKGVTLQELVGWILSFGSQVRIVQSDALRQKVKEEAEKISGA